MSTPDKQVFLKICNVNPGVSEAEVREVLSGLGLSLVPEGFHVAGEAGINIIAVSPEGKMPPSSQAVKQAILRLSNEVTQRLGLAEEPGNISVRAISDFDVQTKKQAQREKSCLVVLTCVPLWSGVPGFSQDRQADLERVVRHVVFTKCGLSVKCVILMPEGKRRREQRRELPHGRLIQETRTITIEMETAMEANLLLKPKRLFDAYINQAELGPYAFYALQKQTKAQFYDFNRSTSAQDVVMQISELPFMKFRDLAQYLKSSANLPVDSVSKRYLFVRETGLVQWVVVRQKPYEGLRHEALQELLRHDLEPIGGGRVVVKQMNAKELPLLEPNLDCAWVVVHFVFLDKSGATVTCVSPTTDQIQAVRDKVVLQWLSDNGLVHDQIQERSQGKVHTLHIQMGSPEHALSFISLPGAPSLLDGLEVPLGSVTAWVTALDIVPAPPGSQQAVEARPFSKSQPVPPQTQAPVPPTEAEAGPPSKISIDKLLELKEEMEAMALVKLEFTKDKKLTLLEVCMAIIEHRDTPKEHRARALMDIVSLEEHAKGVAMAPHLKLERARQALELDNNNVPAMLALADSTESLTEDGDGEIVSKEALKARAEKRFREMADSDSPADLLEVGRLLLLLCSVRSGDGSADRSLSTTQLSLAPASSKDVARRHRPIHLSDGQVEPIPLYQRVVHSSKASPYERYRAYVALGRIATDLGMPVCLHGYDLETGMEACQLFRRAIAEGPSTILPSARYRLRTWLDRKDQKTRIRQVQARGRELRSAELRTDVDGYLRETCPRYWALVRGDDTWKESWVPPPPEMPKHEQQLLLAQEMFAATIDSVPGLATPVTLASLCQAVYQDDAATPSEKAEALELLLHDAEKKGNVNVSVDDTDVDGERRLHAAAKEIIELDANMPHAFDVLAKYIAGKDRDKKATSPRMFLKLNDQKLHADELAARGDALLLQMSQSSNMHHVLRAAQEVMRRLLENDQPTDYPLDLEHEGESHSLLVADLLRIVCKNEKKKSLAYYQAILCFWVLVCHAEDDVLLEEDDLDSQLNKVSVYKLAIEHHQDMPAIHTCVAKCFPDSKSMTLDAATRVNVGEVRRMGEENFLKKAKSCT